MNYKITQNFNFILGLLCALFFAGGTKAILLNDSIILNVDKGHDATARPQITAKLIKITPKLFFYVERSWWDQQVEAKQKEVLFNLEKLSLEFENKIYPNLTSIFGQEQRPGIDGDERITLLFHQMIRDSGGYFRSADEYIKAQVTDSNEKEMLYLPIEQIDSNQLKVFLAHELMHLITFAQKENIFGVQEDVWLNEARAEYVATIFGYDENYEGSNLQRRTRAFLEKPSDSLIEWQDKKYDYAIANLFINYLVDHYGIDILVNSLKSKYVGIESINHALQKAGIKEDFSQIFINWTITVIINDCTKNKNYCYLNKNLINLRISPVINFLPLSGNSSLSVTNLAKNFSSSWKKIIGGTGDLKLNFESLAGLNFKIPYVVYNKEGDFYVKFIDLDSNQKGSISIPNFGENIASLIIIPSLVSEITSVNSFESTYPYTFKVSTTSEEVILSEDLVLIQKLLEKIDYLKKEIARILAERGMGPIIQNLACSQIIEDLYVGKTGDQVRCLQGFLKNQGSEIYPEALITGNFGNLTKQAVIKFQEKYASEILTPLGLSNGTGYVGLNTRLKINQLLGK